jgi:hypothetical protein
MDGRTSVEGGALWLERTTFTMSGFSSRSNGDSVSVLGGAVFYLKDNASIRKCYGRFLSQYERQNMYGAGVFIQDTGHFIMEGGTISECIAATQGGAVYLAAGGSNAPRFTMKGGVIFGNTEVWFTQNSTLRKGGGVAVCAGTFIKENSGGHSGIIYGNEEEVPPQYRNHAENGAHAVYVVSSLVAGVEKNLNKTIGEDRDLTLPYSAWSDPP